MQNRSRSDQVNNICAFSNKDKGDYLYKKGSHATQAQYSEHDQVSNKGFRNSETSSPTKGKKLSKDNL